MGRSSSGAQVPAQVLGTCLHLFLLIGLRGALSRFCIYLMLHRHVIRPATLMLEMSSLQSLPCSWPSTHVSSDPGFPRAPIGLLSSFSPQGFPFSVVFGFRAATEPLIPPQDPTRSLPHSPRWQPHGVTFQTTLSTDHCLMATPVFVPTFRLSELQGTLAYSSEM